MRNLSNTQKLEQLYDLYEQKMYFAAFSILNNEWQAEDAVQEAFVRLLKGISKIKDPAAPESRAYVFRTIKSTAIDQYRKNQNHSRCLVPLDDAGTSDGQDDISRMISSLAAHMVLDRILAKLPSRRKRTIKKFPRQIPGFRR